jgi:hypothetical protein
MEGVMADKIEVHFTSKGFKFRAEVELDKVAGVLILANAGITAAQFAVANQLPPPITPTKEPPPGVKVFQKDTRITNIKTMDGPGVCYWVEGQLICW